MIFFEVQQLYSRYCYLLDDGDADGWAALFAPDGRFIGPGRPVLTGFDEIAAFGRARDHRGIKHLTFNIAIGVADGPRLASAADFALMRIEPDGAGAAVTALGRYQDTLTRVNGQLRFAERVVTRIL
jgi:3-phenylpropionate/cinnamic acid dioxygenase small subunit